MSGEGSPRIYYLREPKFVYDEYEFNEERMGELRRIMEEQERTKRALLEQTKNASKVFVQTMS